MLSLQPQPQPLYLKGNCSMQSAAPSSMCNPVINQHIAPQRHCGRHEQGAWAGEWQNLRYFYQPRWPAEGKLCSLGAARAAAQWRQRVSG